MSDKRFKYYFPSQILEDELTGRRYYGNQQLCDLLNELHEENEKLKQALIHAAVTKEWK